MYLVQNTLEKIINGNAYNLQLKKLQKTNTKYRRQIRTLCVKKKTKTKTKQNKTNTERGERSHLPERWIFGKKAPNRFPINFTSREVNETLVVFRTVFHLKSHIKTQINAYISFNRFPRNKKTNNNIIFERNEFKQTSNSIPLEGHQWNCCKSYREDEYCSLREYRSQPDWQSALPKKTPQIDTKYKKFKIQCKKYKRGNHEPDLPSWWVLRASNRAWCWCGETECDRTKDA